MIDIENLPAFLGGQCDCKECGSQYGCMGPNVGPWNPKGEKLTNIEFKYCFINTLFINIQI